MTVLTDSQRAALTARLQRGRAPGHAGVIPPRPAGLSELPATYGQEQLWFLDRFAPGLATYNIPLALRLTGALDVSALGRALAALTARHEALRTRLVAGDDGRPRQVIDAPGPVPLPVVDVPRLSEFIDARALEPFSLATGPLLRAWLVRVSGAEHVLVIVVHHTVFDGWSARVLLDDLAALYWAEVTGRPSGLASLPVQLADVALWEHGRLRGGGAAELEDHWRRVLADAPVVAFPTDRPRPVVEEFDGGLAQRLIGPDVLTALRELSRREGTTLFVTLMAALHALVHRYTGQDDLVIGTVSAGRNRAELEPLIGFLVNTLPIRADLSGDPAFADLLGRVRQATTEAYAHQDLPFGRLVDALRVARDPGRSPVFQILLTYAEPGDTAIPAAGVAFAGTDLVRGIRAAKFDLEFLAEARGDGLWLECSYKTGLFDAGTIDRLLGHLEVLLRGAAADPAARLSELPLLTDAERHREIVEWNDTAGPVPPGCVHHGFEAQAAATPDAVAAELGDERVTYAELNRQANRIARRLRAAGVGPEALVGVCLPVSLRRLAALLGILKAGGGYVPLDPALPPARLAFMMADAGLAVVMADSRASLPDADAALYLDDEWPAIGELDDTNLGTGAADHGAGPGNVAYVIYTSGSTGRPKGVVVEHRHTVNFVHSMIRQFDIGPADAVLQVASLSFDVSVLDIFAPLLSGARVVLIPARTMQSPARLAALMRDAGVTVACMTPSVLSLLGDERFGDLRALMTAGEELPPELARRWIRRQQPGLRFVNGYGPTETTVIATSMDLTPDTPMPPPIGRPSRPGYQAYVLDERLNPVPAGVTGELHIGGASVARGYLNRPELTAQRFIPDPFTPGGRLYKTGDLVRRRPDGALVFLGRADTQVKVRGLRIELGEIEAALAAHPDVAQAVVTVTADPGGERQLVAYLRAKANAAPGPAALRAHLARTLPGYMIPARLITVDSFPLNTSGKIDRAVLAGTGPPPEPLPAGPEQAAAPATHTEAVVTGLFAAVLHRDRVGVTDSFFDLGGSSLQVMRLVGLIAAETCVDVEVATVFLHPSPRRLAARIDAIRSGGGERARAGPLVELSAGPGELPLFLVHAIGGTVFCYARLAAELAGTFRVYGLEAPGLAEPGATPASLADLADDYTRRIRAAQPHGPYRLGGWSMGGVIAFEIARRLDQAGERVSLLALLDAPFALPDSGDASPERLAGMFVGDVARSLGWDAADAPDPARSTAEEQLGWLAGRLGLDAGLRDRFEVFRTHVRMLAGYRPENRPVSAPALIVGAAGSPNAPAMEQWPAVLGGPAGSLRVGGDHYAFLRPPLVAEVGTAIVRTWEESVSVSNEIAAASREGLARVLDVEVGPADLDLDLDMADGYGLTSLNKVIFLMSACDDTGVSLTEFTEPDVAGMRTLRDVIDALSRFAGTAA